MGATLVSLSGNSISARGRERQKEGVSLTSLEFYLGDHSVWPQATGFPSPSNSTDGRALGPGGPSPADFWPQVWLLIPMKGGKGSSLPGMLGPPKKEKVL